MKTHIISTIGWIVMACALAGCAHTTKTASNEDGRQIVAIGIARDGALSVAGQPCPPSQLVPRLSIYADQGTTAFTVRADAEAPYSHVIKVMDACKEAGLQNVSLAETR